MNNNETKEALIEYLNKQEKYADEDKRPSYLLKFAAKAAIREFLDANRDEIISAIANANICYGE